MVKYGQANSSNGSAVDINRNIYIYQVSIYAIPGSVIEFITTDSSESKITMGGTGIFQLNFGDRPITAIKVTPIEGTNHPVIVDYLYEERGSSNEL